MKTSISLRAALSRSSRIVDAGRGTAASAMQSLQNKHPMVRDGASAPPHHEVNLILRSGPWAASRRMNVQLSWNDARKIRLLSMRHLLLRRAGLRLQISALVDAGDRQG